jgi:hypothetical protein
MELNMKKLIVILALISMSATAFAACPNGTTLNPETKTCEGKVICPNGYYNDDMQMCECISSGTKCPKGSKLDSMTGVCHSAPKCPPATMFDVKKGLCIGVPQ